MAKKLLLLVPLLAGVPLFVTGALRRPPLAPIASFTTAPVALAADIQAIGPRARVLLDAAIDRVAPQRLTWLHVKLWQRMNEPQVAFESEGTLQLGPNHCARLEVNVHTSAMPGRRLVVSDGHAVAQVTHHGTADPVIESRLLAPPPVPEHAPPPAPEQVLRDLGCGGPHALLTDLRTRLQDLGVDTGNLQGSAVIRLRGRHGASSAAVGSTAGADICYLYLDAQTLWPGRIEWWTSERKGGARLMLELEFRAPVRNQPLSVEQCIRAFSYKPAADVAEPRPSAASVATAP